MPRSSRCCEKTAGPRAGFHRVFAVPDDPIAIDEAEALSLVILGPATPHVGRGAGKSAATEAVTDTLMRCRSAQRRFRNTLLFVAADETQLATAREAMRRALAWEIDRRRSAPGQARRQAPARANDPGAAGGRARQGEEQPRRRGARGAGRLEPRAVSRSKSTEPGKPFDLDHLALTARDRASVPAAVYDKASAKGDGIIKESSRRRNPGYSPCGALAGGPAASAGGRDRRMVRDLCLSAEAARPGGAGDRDPRRARQARPEIRLCGRASTRRRASTPASSGRRRRSARCRKPPSWCGRRLRWRSCVAAAPTPLPEAGPTPPGGWRLVPAPPITRGRPRTGNRGGFSGQSRSTWFGR